jgi:hypothetical protein
MTVSPPRSEHLVGGGQQRFRDGEAEGLGGLEVYDHLKFCRCLHRHIGGRFPVEDAVDVSCCANILISRFRAVGYKTPISRKESQRINRRQFKVGRERDDLLAMDDCRSARCDDQATFRFARKFSEGASHLVGAAHINYNQLFDTE